MAAPKYLKRYRMVQGNEMPALSRITERIGVEFDPQTELEKLRDIHKAGIEEYRKLRAGLDLEAVEALAYPDILDRLRLYTQSFLEIPKASPSLLDLKVAIVDRMLENCTCCERRCEINRKEGEKGFCRLTDVSRYASEFLHMGEEPELVPSHTIFFTGCVFACVYCQNWDISTCPESGTEIDPRKLAKLVDFRRLHGAKNVNFVTPAPHPHTVLKIVREMSSNTPVIWNSNMYHSKEIAEILEGVVDVYLGDFKYGNNACALKFSKVKNYLEVVRPNFEFAYETAEILLRHLALPGHIECCTRPIAEWVSEHTPHTRFNLMFQYRPCYRAMEYPDLGRHLTLEEQTDAIDIVRGAGIEDLLI
ncbi:anaerobic ribonucleoside-triphosphate reductase activating protein [Methanosarcina siciliae T4/M]|uniref:Anaerobic ribonucleoside-triphosphate reductase activating protein n=1 Tax=Methanosarcina siciliae T4/M TaxID=1434120 RepID=A0A0E3P5B0_9EURY|nr:radical SAM protein [Methanosarcina siciliae]AKB28830.1 anaerobic ribonucleoside-triphosphate reductase activating protein [Methanosarcina siciliae T4/M]